MRTAGQSRLVEKNDRSRWSNFIETWKGWAQTLRQETYALYLAVKDPQVPWYVRTFALVVVAYAFSPIDLVPDFIPVLGYLDDLILVPLGIALAFRMIPDEVLQRARMQAQEVMQEGRPTNWRAGAVILAIWILVLGIVVAAVVRAIR
jgi:uncharacterized membrane protein YkvA (DUF1232 family)